MKNKILTISIIFILISFIFINNVFASEISIDISTIVGENPWCVFLDNEGNYHLAVGSTSNGSYRFFYNGTSLSFGIDIANGTTKNISLYDFNLSSLEFEYSSIQNSYSNIKEFLYASKDIRTSQGSNTAFFQQTPVQASSLLIQAELTLAQELERIQVMEHWKALMKNVVVSLVMFLVGLIAFFKAWAWLKTQLQKA